MRSSARSANAGRPAHCQKDRLCGRRGVSSHEFQPIGVGASGEAHPANSRGDGPHFVHAAARSSPTRTVNRCGSTPVFVALTPSVSYDIIWRQSENSVVWRKALSSVADGPVRFGAALPIQSAAWGRITGGALVIGELRKMVNSRSRSACRRISSMDLSASVLLVVSLCHQSLRTTYGICSK